MSAMTRWGPTALSLVVAAPAFGQAVDVYGFDAHTVALAGTQASADGDYTAVYYNPALILGSDRPSVGVGFSWMKPFTFANATSNPDNETFGYQVPPDYSVVSLGAALPFGGKLSHRFALGFGLSVPVGHVYKDTMVDPSVPYFYQYDSAPDRLQLLVAAAARPIEALTLGIGAQIQSDFGGGPPSNFDALVGTNTGGRIVYRSLTNEINGVVAPTAGVAIAFPKGIPWIGDRLSIYASWRGQVAAKYELPINIQLDTVNGPPIDTLGINVSGYSYYTPHEFTLGGRFRITDSLSASVDLSYEMWHMAPNPQVSVDVSFDRTLAELLSTTCITSRTPSGPAVPPALCPPGAETPVNFSDIWLPRVALEYQLSDAAAARLGYFYRPSMVPPQSGLTNFLDPSVHVVSAGGGYAIPDPLEMGRRLVFDAAIQLGFMVPQDVVKTTHLLAYQAGGTTLDLVISLKYEF
jgi:long-chain fatty acid transport protein